MLSCLACNTGKLDSERVRLFDTSVSDLAPHRTNFVWEFKLASTLLVIFLGIATRIALMIWSKTDGITIRTLYLFLFCKSGACIISSAWLPSLAHAARVYGPAETRIETHLGICSYLAVSGCTLVSLMLAFSRKNSCRIKLD